MLSVREITKNDVSSLIHYWVNSSDAHMLAMGADLTKLPSEESLYKSLTEQIELPLDKKQSYALIWFLNDFAVGHCNVNQIQFGKEAYMHLHLWESENRQKGLGKTLVEQSIPVFFKNLQLQTLYCEPYALNPAPNRTLEKLGFTFVKEHITVPGYLNFEQKVNLWKLEK
ncbi:GNAT family N-acetyltransferase [Ulvibacter antarcticus]|uniref:RimJ/RimL family protein N-acetyltransferase n=1 Tax=Ulvibacter antarcticus TaxID=442714 RepID=A0A3L9Z2G7_9FLAO|nr:GNAT family protein [Ulvibacter antarcticus]RMA66197.1 RimJ/RimL family protein N-acetyltransferase [Ulvibacter antarcticus]